MITIFPIPSVAKEIFNISNDWLIFFNDLEFISLYTVASNGSHNKKGDVLTVIS